MSMRRLGYITLTCPDVREQHSLEEVDIIIITIIII